MEKMKVWFDFDLKCSCLRKDICLTIAIKCSCFMIFLNILLWCLSFPLFFMKLLSMGGNLVGTAIVGNKELDLLHLVYDTHNRMF